MNFIQKNNQHINNYVFQTSESEGIKSNAEIKYNNGTISENDPENENDKHSISSKNKDRKKSKREILSKYIKKN